MRIWWSWAATIGRTRHSTRPSTAPWRSNLGDWRTGSRTPSISRGRPRARAPMRAKQFEPVVTGWTDALRWTKDEVGQAAKVLAAISAANAGGTAPDAELDAESKDEFALHRAEDALA